MTQSQYLEALWRSLRRLEAARLHYLEDCVSCGICYKSCPWHEVDPRYSPPALVEWMRRFYRRYATIAGRVLRRAVNAFSINYERLLIARDYAYRCTNCGACYMVCAYGIDSGLVAEMLRDLIDAAGLTPGTIKKLEEIEVKEEYLKSPQVQELWKSFLDEVKKIIGKDPPIDVKTADYLLVVTLNDLLFLKDALLNTIKILNNADVLWTLPSRILGIRPPIAYCSGNLSNMASVLRTLITYIHSLEPKHTVIIDCGYPYYVFRFEIPYVTGIELKTRILSVVELIDDFISKRWIYVRNSGIRATWHDPCMLGRRSGVLHEPEEIMKEITTYIKLKRRGKYSFCCGLGLGNYFFIRDVYETYSKVLGVDVSPTTEDMGFISRLMKDVEVVVEERCSEIRKKGIHLVVTACPACIKAFEIAKKELEFPELTSKHIATIVGEQLVESVSRPLALPPV